MKTICDEIDARTHGTRQGTVEMDGLQVAVRILDTRRNFGRIDALVTPIAGSGERWIDLDRVQAPKAGKEQGK